MKDASPLNVRDEICAWLDTTILPDTSSSTSAFSLVLPCPTPILPLLVVRINGVAVASFCFLNPRVPSVNDNVPVFSSLSPTKKIVLLLTYKEPNGFSAEPISELFAVVGKKSP